MKDKIFFPLFIICLIHVFTLNAQENCFLVFRKIEKSSFFVPKFSDNADSCTHVPKTVRNDNGRIWSISGKVIDSVGIQDDTLFVHFSYMGMSVCANSDTSRILMVEINGMTNLKRRFSVSLPLRESIPDGCDYLSIESFGNCFIFKKKKRYLFVLDRIEYMEIDPHFCKRRKVPINLDCSRW